MGGGERSARQLRQSSELTGQSTSTDDAYRTGRGLDKKNPADAGRITTEEVRERNLRTEASS